MADPDSAVAVNPHERKLLEEIEQSLAAEDPDLARRLNMPAPPPAHPRSAPTVPRTSWFARLEARAAERWARRREGR